MRPTVVLDKSFLQGSKAATIHEMSKSHRLLMADALFYELISDPKGRALCFAKFPKTENPVDLIGDPGVLLRREVQTHTPCGKPSEHCEKIRFQFNAALLRDDYQLPSDMAATVLEHTEELRSDVASYLDTVRLTPTFFPDILKGNDASRAIARQEAERAVAEETDNLLGFYRLLTFPPGEPSLPPADIVTRDWALFRWVQVKLLFALDVYCRYSGKLPEPLSTKVHERLEHDVLDAQYLILGLLEGAFATREKKLQRWWRLLSPKGALYD
jgi:hypothetical protein